MKKIVTIILTLSLLISWGCSIKENGSSSEHEKPFIESSNTFILETIEKNIYGTKTPQKIVLYAEQTKDGIPVAWSLVIDGKEKVKLHHEDGLYGYADVKLLDLDGDARNEVLLYRQSSGSAGARGLNIYKPTPGEWTEIFNVTDPADFDDNRYRVKYLGNYYVSFEDTLTGLKAIITLDKKNYHGLEDMLGNIDTWVDPIAEYSIVDHDGDGVKEIVTIQRVIGIAHVDTMALLKTTHKRVNGKYIPVILSIADRNDKPLAEVKL